MVKSFRAAEVLEAHWERLASYLFEDTTAFWGDSAVRADFVAKKFSTITWAEFIEAFYVMYFPEN